MTRFRALASLLLLAAASVLHAASSLEFVHIADTHVADFTGVNATLAAARRQNNGSADALRRFFDRIGREAPPAFIVHTGDAIEAYCFDGANNANIYGQIPLFGSIYKASRIPMYMALGNHDTECYRQPADGGAPAGDHTVSAEARRQWTQTLRCFRKGTYYSLRQRAGHTTYRLLFLDNGEGQDTIDPKYRAAQFQWVAREAAGAGRDALILVMHVPYRDDWFFKELAAALGKSARVSLLIAGHRHSDGIEEIVLGGHPITQVRTAALAGGDSNWRRFRLLEDRIEVDATGKPGTIVKTIPIQ